MFFKPQKFEGKSKRAVIHLNIRYGNDFPLCFPHEFLENINFQTFFTNWWIMGFVLEVL